MLVFHAVLEVSGLARFECGMSQSNVFCGIPVML